MKRPDRYSTGVSELDKLLGGGLIPGTLTVVVGATGIGKTQLGLQYLHAASAKDEPTGIVFDVTSRMDSQNHAEYANRMFGWNLELADSRALCDRANFFSSDRRFGQYLRIFERNERPVVQRATDFDAWHSWQADLARSLDVSLAYLYGNFCRGVRRVLFDGLEPADSPADSVQLQLFEYVYHQILRKDSAWVARDLFRQDFLANEPAVGKNAYRHQDICAVLLSTSHETMLTRMIDRGLNEGDLLSGANTLIYMGKIALDGNKMGRGLYIAKHRGSACTDDIIPYTIDDHGLRMDLE